MLTKITTGLLAIAIGVIALMGITHSAEKARLSAKVSAANGAAEIAKRERVEAENRAELAEKANISNRNAIASLNTEIGIHRQLAEQEKERARSIQARYDEMTSRYHEAIQNDPAARDWASRPVPDAVSSGRLLYRPQGGDGRGDDGGDATAAGDRSVPANPATRQK